MIDGNGVTGITQPGGVNPATGLPMVNGVDTQGNPFGSGFRRPDFARSTGGHGSPVSIGDIALIALALFAIFHDHVRVFL